MSSVAKIMKNHWFIAGVLFLAISAIFYLYTPRFADQDSFFYIRLAEQYRSNGLTAVEFPWIYHSVTRQFSSALWYGFGIFLVPFTYFGDLSIGIKAAGIILTASALFIFYAVLRRHQFRWPLFWPFLLMFAAPNILYRFFMVRPQLTSVSLSVLLFSFLVSGGALSVFLATLGIVWIHFNFFWLPLAIAIVVLGLRFLIEKRIEYKKILAVIAGTVVGWILRPEAINTLKLVYVQVFQQIFERQSGLPLLYGTEHYPLLLATLTRNFPLITLVWLAAIALFFLVLQYHPHQSKLRPTDKIFLWGSLIISLTFFLLTMLVARRAYDLWVPFLVLFVAAVVTYLWSWRPMNNLITILVLVTVFNVCYAGYRTGNDLLTKAYDVNRLREAALWLKDNSQPGDIVFNTRWSRFSELFYWNQTNYYTGGLDPIFQYAYNDSLYWKYHYLAIDEVTNKTCGAIECTESMMEDTHLVLQRDFKAKYVLLDKNENPLVNNFMSADSRFEKKFESGSAVVYLIKKS